MAAPRNPVSADITDFGAWVDYVPVITAQTPGITPPTFTLNEAKYAKLGKVVVVFVSLNIVAQGTGLLGILVDPPLPIAAGLGGLGISGLGVSYEFAATGFMGNAVPQSVGTFAQKITLRKHDATTWIVTGQSVVAVAVYRTT